MAAPRLNPESGSYQILDEALGKLRERRERIQPLIEEGTEADKAIAILAKALGVNEPNPTPPRPTRAQVRIGEIVRNAASPRGKFTQRIVDLVRDEPRSVASIAHTFGSSERYVGECVEHAVRRGELAFTDGGAVTAP